MTQTLAHLSASLAGRYTIERELGRGGMATVYLARDEKHSRHVAIKVLRPELAGVMTRGRFLREIRISSELAHPNILSLLDSGTTPPSDDFPALPFYTMPFVEGESLRDRLARERQLPIEDALQIAAEVADALGYAHSHDVVHRDIKPENILLMDGHAVVADFGIARAIGQAVDPEALTSAGIVIGTPAYMSPEQAAGTKDLDGRSDIYSLGCVVYEMLGGEPPFSGATPQAVLARQVMDSAPSLRTIRTTVPGSIELAVKRALQKSPADRFATAEQFADVLRHPTSAGDGTPAWTRRRVLIGLVVVLLAFLGWRVVESRKFIGDPNKVVVFPLAEIPADANLEGTGAMVASMIETALEYNEPLQWIDGQQRLDVKQRRDAGLLTTAEAHRITRAAGARWYLSGRVVRQGDSATVILWLHDAQGDSLAGSADAIGLAAEASQAGVSALKKLLPLLLAPGQRMADVAALTDASVKAVALWLQGEREYRSFNFAKALEFQQQAVDADSSFAIAAIRGAQAASWLNRMEETNSLSGVAMRNLSRLPGRMAAFTRGLHAYGHGEADSAVYWLSQALKANPGWTEAHMALGEVYYHLLPSTQGRLDSMAEVEFKASATDSGLSPARFHLAEMAIRRGDTTGAKQAIADFVRLAQNDASSEERTELELMLGCARKGRKGVDWRKAATIDPVGVLRAGTMLVSGAAFPGCAEDGFRAVFDLATGSLGNRWGGFLGLQGLLAAEGRTSELRALVDSAIAVGLTLADQLYMLDALAGAGVEREAASVAARTGRGHGGQTYASSLWLAGEWSGQTGDSVTMKERRDSLAARAAQLENPAVARFAQALGARLVLLRGDTTAAIGRLRAVLSVGRREVLDWDLGEPLASDRLLLAELLLARGQLREAGSAAAIFDNPGTPIVFLPYLPASLDLRRRIALKLGQVDEARKYQSRLAALGRKQQWGSAAPTSTSEGS